jgi:hypothetical protein
MPFDKRLTHKIVFCWMPSDVTLTSRFHINDVHLWF